MKNKKISGISRFHFLFVRSATSLFRRLLLVGLIASSAAHSADFERYQVLTRWLTDNPTTGLALDGTQFLEYLPTGRRPGAERTVEVTVAVGWTGNLGYDAPLIGPSNSSNSSAEVLIAADAAGLVLRQGAQRIFVPVGLSDGRFHRLAIVYRPDSVVVYEAGEFVGELRWYGAGGSADTITIGGSRSVNRSFVGVLGNIRIWDSALSPQQLRDLARILGVPAEGSMDPQLTSQLLGARAGGREMGSFRLEAISANTVMTGGAQPPQTQSVGSRQNPPPARQGWTYWIRDDGMVMRSAPDGREEDIGNDAGIIASCQKASVRGRVGCEQGDEIYVVNWDNASVWKYLGSPWQWEYIGADAAGLDIDDSGLYLVHRSDNALHRYQGSPHQWQRTNEKVPVQPAGTAGLAATRPSAIPSPSATPSPASNPPPAVPRNDFPVEGVVFGGRAADVIRVSPDPALNLGDRSTFEFWVEPAWDDASKPSSNFVELLRHGTTSQHYWTLYMTADRQSLLLQGAGVEESVYFDFADGRAHHVAAVRDRGYVTVYVDGLVEGEFPFEFGSAVPRGYPIQIGSPHFRGQIGALRFWKGVRSDDLIQRFIQHSESEGYGGSEFANLVGYLAGSGRFQTIGAVYDITGVWRFESDQTGQRFRGNPFAFVPETITLIEPVPSGQGSLMLLTFEPNNAEQPLKSVRLEPFARNQFDGDGSLLVIEGTDEFNYQGRTYRRQLEPDEREETFGGAFTFEAVVKGIPFAEAGWDIASVDPWDISSGAGQKQPVFAHIDNSSRRFTSDFGKTVPAGLYYREEIRSDGFEQCTSLTSTQEYFNALSRSYSVDEGYDGQTTVSGEVDIIIAEVEVQQSGRTAALFSTNHQVQESLSKMTSEQRAHCVAGVECYGYSLQLNRAHAQLDRQFRDRILDLRGASAWEYDRFVADYGTHYAHGVIYGAKAITDQSIRQSDIRAVTESGVLLKAGVDLWVLGAGLSAKIELSNSQREAVQRIVEEKRRSMKTVGGAAGFQPEEYQCAENTYVPIRLDLRSLHEIAAPPFFTDPVVVRDVRAGINQAIDRKLLSDMQRAVKLSPSPVVKLDFEPRSRPAQLPLNRNLYLRSAEEPADGFDALYVSTYGGSMIPSAAHPDRGHQTLHPCPKASNHPNCQWRIVPSATRPGAYYLRASDKPLALHAWGGSRRDNHATLHACPEQNNHGNCQWKFTPSPHRPDAYYLQVSDQNLYLGTTGRTKGTHLTLQACGPESGDNPACQWIIEE